MTEHEASRDEAQPGVPRWVKVIGLVMAVVVALVLLAQLTGVAGDHGPGRHLSRGLGPAEPATVSARSGGSGW